MEYDSEKAGREKCEANQKKNTFRTEREARMASENLNRRNPSGMTTRPFTCKFCGLFHVGVVRNVEERRKRVLGE